MIKKNSFAFIRFAALVLVFALTLPMGANAAVQTPVQPRASYYLDSYNGYVYPAGNGKIQVWFTVTGTDTMDDIGCLTIQIYESSDNSNWRWVKAFDYTNHEDMMTTNDFFHTGHVDYQGTAGKYYRAYLTIYAGENGDGDSRYFYTSSKLAT
jgi:hypothetical protein